MLVKLYFPILILTSGYDSNHAMYIIIFTVVLILMGKILNEN